VSTKLPSAPRHAKRLSPRIELRLLNCADDARDGEVVVIPRSDVPRVASELLLCALCDGEESTYRRDWRALLLPECRADPAFDRRGCADCGSGCVAARPDR
jgi:hypothetical protein